MPKIETNIFADKSTLPNLDCLQSAFLNDPESEEELISVVQHLVACSIEDPGLPFYPKVIIFKLIAL